MGVLTHFLIVLFCVSVVVGNEHAETLASDLSAINQKLYEIVHNAPYTELDLRDLTHRLVSALSLLNPSWNYVSNEELTTVDMVQKMRTSVINTYYFLVYAMSQERKYNTQRILTFGLTAQIYARLYKAMSFSDYQDFVAPTATILFDPPHVDNMQIDQENGREITLEDEGDEFPVVVTDVLALQRYYLTYFMTEILEYLDDGEPTVCENMLEDLGASRILYWSNVLQTINYVLLASSNDFTIRNYKADMHTNGLQYYLAQIQRCLTDMPPFDLRDNLQSYITDLETQHFTPNGDAATLARLQAFSIDTLIPALTVYINQEN